MFPLAIYVLQQGIS